MSTTKKVLNVTQIALNPYGYLFGKIAETVAESVDESGDATKLELSQLRLNAEKQELQMRMAEAQARVAQELAIAKRIEMATEVEIEEFYDIQGEGSLGVKADEKAVTLGASASGQKVCKRVYHFRGGNIGTSGEA